MFQIKIMKLKDDDNDKMLVKLRQQEQDNDCDKERQPNSNHSNNQQISTASNSSGRPRGRPKLNRTVLKTKAKRKRKTFIMSSNATQNLVIANNDDMAATTNSSANSILKNANKNKLIDDNESKWDPSRLSTKTLVCFIKCFFFGKKIRCYIVIISLLLNPMELSVFLNT